jgi:hypothetical protein
MSITTKIKGIKAVKDAIFGEVFTTINKVQRASSISAVNELSDVTPVDTGRARSAWSVNTTQEVFDDYPEGSLTARPVLALGPIPKDRIETLYLTNGAPYIAELNAGSSKQAPPRFIEKTVSKYFLVKDLNITQLSRKQ